MQVCTLLQTDKHIDNNKPFIGFWQPRKAGLNKHTGKSRIHKIHKITSTDECIQPCHGHFTVMPKWPRPADVPFGDFVDIAPHFGSKIPPKPQFLGRE